MFGSVFRGFVLHAICSIQEKPCSAPYTGFVVKYGLPGLFALRKSGQSKQAKTNKQEKQQSKN